MTNYAPFALFPWWKVLEKKPKTTYMLYKMLEC